MDKRLEEQLERMRQLSARVARIHEQLEKNTELLTRVPAHGRGPSPLHEVRELRTWSQPDPGEPHDVRHGRRPGAQAADRPRRRRRRRERA